MKKSVRELRDMERNIVEALNNRGYRLNQIEKDLGCIRKEMAVMERNLRKVQEDIRNSKEILEQDAPNSCKRWEPAVKEMLEEQFQDWLYRTASKYGRSTLSIRFKVAEFISDHIGPQKWKELGPRG